MKELSVSVFQSCHDGYGFFGRAIRGRIGGGAYVVVGALALILALSAPVRADELFPDPGLTDPRLRFATGRVVANQPEVAAELPDIPGPVSGWVVGQWQHTHYLSSADLLKSPTINDSRFGRALYAFDTPFDESHLWIFRDHSSYIYELFERDGTLIGGGANLFLSAGAVIKAEMDKPIDYSLAVRMSKADARYWTATAESSGAVMAQVFTGFVLRFDDPNSRRKINLFLQIPLSGSRPGPSRYRNCHANNDIVGVTANEGLGHEAPLAFQPDAGRLHAFRFRLNDYLCAVVTQPASCQNDGKTVPLASYPGIRKLKNWRLQSMYVGLETQSQDLRPASPIHVPQGSVEAGLQLSGLHVVRDTAHEYGDGFCH